MHEMERHRAEQPFVNPRRSKGAATMRSRPACRGRRTNNASTAVISPVFVQSEMCSASTPCAARSPTSISANSGKGLGRPEGEPRHLLVPFGYRRGVMAAMRLAPRASEPILAKRDVNETAPPKEAAHIALNWRSLRARSGNGVVLDQPSRSRRSRCPTSPRSTTRERCQRYRLCRLRRRASRSS
jgi:hypothetical protein